MEDKKRRKSDSYAKGDKIMVKVTEKGKFMLETSIKYDLERMFGPIEELEEKIRSSASSPSPEVNRTPKERTIDE